MAPRPVVCTRARLRVFTPCRHLATQGDPSCTKQVVLRQCELGWIRDFPLAGRSCELCDIPTGFFLTWSDCLQEGREWFILPDQTSRKVPISVNCCILCFVTRAWAEPPQNCTQATGKSFPCFLSCARFNAVAWKISSGVTKAWVPGLIFASEIVFFLAALGPVGTHIYRSNLQESYSVLHLNLH